MTLRRLLLSLVVITMMVGCSAPVVSGQPISAAPLFGGQNQSPLVQAPANATATPTPFQPLAPTAMYYPTDVPTSTPTPIPTAAPTPFPSGPSAPVGALSQPPDQVNILLLGSDQRPRGAIFRTDTIILATLNPSKGTVNLTSFPRDLYINIPGWGMDRINTAYQHGGFQKLGETLQYNFGVRPDHYVLINFSSFKEVVDSLGGLDVNVATTVSDYRAGRYFTVKAGVQHMDADLVLWYVRTRKTTNDFARGRRQQEVLMAIVNKMLSLNAIKRAPEFYNIYKENVTTDLTLADLLPFLPLAAQLTDTSNIHHYFIGPPQVSDWITPGGGMVLLPRQDRIREVLRKALGGE